MSVLARVVRNGVGVIAALLAVVLLTASGIALAAIPDAGSGLIHGCRVKTTGALRVIDVAKKQHCKSTEAALNWNQRGINWRGTWSASVTYAKNDVVARAGSSYVALKASKNVAPANATYWAVLAMAGATGAQGAPGSQGQQGVQGIQGVQGVQGIQGPVGPTYGGGGENNPGPDTAVSVGNVVLQGDLPTTSVTTRVFVSFSGDFYEAASTTSGSLNCDLQLFEPQTSGGTWALIAATGYEDFDGAGQDHQLPLVGTKVEPAGTYTARIICNGTNVLYDRGDVILWATAA